MTTSSTPTTTHTDTRQHYRDYYQNFNINNLLTEIYGEHLDDQRNAYMACCGRHVRDGRGEHLALVHEDTAGNVTRLSFAELDKASGHVANLLQSYGVQAGDQVATMLPRTPELLTIVLATWRIGAVYQPLFTAFGYESIKYRMDKANTKVVFTNLENRGKFEDLAEQAKMVLVGGNDSQQDHGWGDDLYEEVVAAQSSTAEPVLLETDAPFLQMFTSGTVGKSKGVSVPLSALSAFYLYMRYAIDLRADDNYWNMADPGWAYGLYYAITGPLLMGITTHFNESGFDAENTRDFMVRHKITNLASSPTAFRMMKSSGVFERAHDDSDAALSLRCANSAGETLNTEVVNWVETYLNCKVCDQYGQTETGMTCCEHHALTHECPVGSMGMALPGHTLVVLDDDMNVLPDGEQGQLAVVVSQSPAFYFRGYSWNEKDAFVGDYYLTGDVVERHSDGSYWFSGRDDDIIITAGYRVGPTDVENTVLEHDAVAESAAVGVPDEVRGHTIKSYVVLKDGIEGSDELAKEIQALVRKRLSTHAYPRDVEFVAALPKTPSGKIQRFLLRSLSAA
ncbi:MULTISPECIES: AMP-binding protein [unclassified Psychrobacter]|uniref:AMP-binding protein n=1 Tax=unclassified Psychrobacter TaxID=196806 RepID=UPI0009469BE5|nr:MULTISPECIES: AMP-binding protein [unclassified Psychrobacter]OLF41276.1 AMP-binding protein [Psychrobacter sp. Rd 27.2]PJX24959.1 AMP-binding protein [Psychrobacter sp. L7]